MTKPPTADLIARLESAKAEDQTDVVRDALRFALDQGWITADAYRRAYAMCNAGAFLDAALMLVPVDMHWEWGFGVAQITDFRSKRTFEGEHYNDCPALSLTIAALKAITNG